MDTHIGRRQFLRGPTCVAAAAALAGSAATADVKPHAALRVADFQSHVLELKKQLCGTDKLNPDEGLLIGTAETEVRGILMCWMPTVAALERAVAEGCNLVVAHEQFFFYPFISAPQMQPQFRSWRPTARRLAVVERHHLCVLRLHGTMDMLHNFDDFVELMGLTNTKRGSGYARVFPIPETTVGELVARVKRTLGLEQVRMVGNPARRVRCVGVPMGGLCLDSNLSYLQKCVQLGADVLIGGEADEYGFTFAADADIPLIEAGHFVSETPGVKNFAQHMQRDFPGVKIITHGERPFCYR